MDMKLDTLDDALGIIVVSSVEVSAIVVEGKLAVVVLIGTDDSVRFEVTVEGIVENIVDEGMEVKLKTGVVVITGMEVVGFSVEVESTASVVVGTEVD